MGIDQSEFIRPFLTPAHDLRVSVYFVEFGHMLDRTPAGDMPVLALAEYPVKQPRRAEQANMTSMKRRNRPPCDGVFPRQEDWRSLLPCRRTWKHIFNEVVRQPTVNQCRFAAAWNSKRLDCAWFKHRQSVISVMAGHQSESPATLFDRRAADIAADAKDDDLAETNRFRVRHAKSRDPREIGAQ